MTSAGLKSGSFFDIEGSSVTVIFAASEMISGFSNEEFVKLNTPEERLTRVVARANGCNYLF